MSTYVGLCGGKYAARYVSLFPKIPDSNVRDNNKVETPSIVFTIPLFKLYPSGSLIIPKTYKARINSKADQITRIISLLNRLK